MSSDNIRSDLNPELLRRQARADHRMERMRQRRRQLAIRRRIIFAAIVLGLAAVICIFGIIPAARKAASPDTEVNEAAGFDNASGDSIISAISDDDPAAYPDQQEEEVPDKDPMFLPDSGDGTAFSAVFTDDTQYLADEQVQSSYAILIDADNREVVLQRDGQVVVSPASMTKILTLLVAVEHITDIHDTFIMTEEITNYLFARVQQRGLQHRRRDHRGRHALRDHSGIRRRRCAWACLLYSRFAGSLCRVDE